MNFLIILITSFFVYSLSFANLIDEKLYEKLNTPTLDKKVLDRALEGMSEIDVKNKDIITIIDYTKSANEKRMFIIDLKKEKVIVDTYVAHGKNSGGEYANSFSNTINSKQSSVGFFETSYPYVGINGYSMRLKGLEKDINDKAKVRAIVIHGADYVSEKYIEKNGRLGRSWGCPAVSRDVNKKVINTIKDGTLVYINGDIENYKRKTKFHVFSN